VQIRTEAEVIIKAHLQNPPRDRCGMLVLLHGLESSAESGYMRSLAAAALARGYSVCRLNTRTCGGPEQLSRHFYHAGLTSDVLTVLKEFRKSGEPKPWVVGFSLGANVVLKLAGELGQNARDTLSGVAAVSPPLDLEACCRRMPVAARGLYDRRFTFRLKSKYRRFHRLYPERFPLEWVRGVDSVRSFDDRVTSRCFGFDDAMHYYRTQSSGRFVSGIRVPTLVVQAQDDPLIPFEAFRSPGLRENPNLSFVFPDNGGHVAFLAKGMRRFWVDDVVLEWIGSQGSEG